GEGGRDVAGQGDGMDAGCRGGAMRAGAGDGNIEIGAARHHRTGADLKFPDCQSRPVVHPKDRVAWKAREEPVLDHRLAAAEPLFGGLEDQVDGAVEISGFGQVASGAEQHRGVPVMAAGVHASPMARAVDEIGRLLDRQRVHVSPQADRARRGARAQPPDHTRAADPAKDLVTEFCELICDEIGGPLLLEAELGVRVNIAAPARQIVVIIPNALDDAHYWLSSTLPRECHSADHYPTWTAGRDFTIENGRNAGG